MVSDNSYMRSSRESGLITSYEDLGDTSEQYRRNVCKLQYKQTDNRYIRSEDHLKSQSPQLRPSLCLALYCEPLKLFPRGRPDPTPDVRPHQCPGKRSCPICSGRSRSNIQAEMFDIPAEEGLALIVREEQPYRYCTKEAYSSTLVCYDPQAPTPISYPEPPITAGNCPAKSVGVGGSDCNGCFTYTF